MLGTDCEACVSLDYPVSWKSPHVLGRLRSSRPVSLEISESSCFESDSRCVLNISAATGSSESSSIQ